MYKEDTSSDYHILSIDEARSRDLVPLTIADYPNARFRVGDGMRCVCYVEWLRAEQTRVTRFGDRQAEIVDEGRGLVALWVDSVSLSE